MWSKTWRRKERGTRGRKVEVEMSPKRERLRERGMLVMEREGSCWRVGMEGQEDWAAAMS